MEILLNLECLYSCSPRALFPFQCLLLESERAEVHGSCPSNVLVAVLAITGGPRAADLMDDCLSKVTANVNLSQDPLLQPVLKSHFIYK